MPRKKREIRAELRRRGFTNRGGKGDHGVWVHPLVPGHMSVDGKDGDDAKPYDERNLRKALDALAQAEAQQQKGKHQGKRP
jgi:HicA toxin of bacterial toxin-antitoxin,